jgi:hypothetical protein
VEELAKRKKLQGLNYYALYQQDPRAASGAEWPAEYFPPSLWFDDWPTTGLQATALALDPAQGKGEHGCYASFVLTGIDLDGVVWCEAWLSQSWDATALVNEGMRLCREYNPTGFGVEVNGGQAFLASLFLERAKTTQQHVPLHSINQTTNKEARIREIGPYLAQRKIRIRNTPGGKLLVGQLQEFPVGPFKDGPDAMQQSMLLLAKLMGAKRAAGKGSGSGPKLARG